MGRRAVRSSLVLVLLLVTAGVADARGGMGGGVSAGGGGGSGGGGRRGNAKNPKGAAQIAAILDCAIRRDNLRRSRHIAW